MTRPLLLLGEYDVGKSHFGAQLLGRLNQQRGELRMVGAANLAPFETALARLNAGMAAPHTPQDTFTDSLFPLEDRAGRRFDLLWPDYGGEQVRIIRDERRMSAEWRERVRTTAGWVVMVRVAHAQLSDDISTRPVADPSTRHGARSDFIMSQQAKLVELLQWLVYIRGSGTLAPIASPPLMLLLSCWDELPTPELALPPIEVLRARMPMVAAFVEANWAPDALKVWGLSALERALSETDVDGEYVDRGPEAFGYAVLPDGVRSPDLTLPIAALL